MSIHLKLISRCCVEQVEGIELQDIVVMPVSQETPRRCTVDRQAARSSERRADCDAARRHRVARQTQDRRRRQAAKNTSSNAVCAPTPNSNANALTTACPMPTRPLGGDVMPRHLTSTSPPRLLPPRARSFVYQHRYGEKPAAHGRSPCDGRGRSVTWRDRDRGGTRPGLRDITAARHGGYQPDRPAQYGPSPCQPDRPAQYGCRPYQLGEFTTNCIVDVPSPKRTTHVTPRPPTRPAVDIINRQQTPKPRRSRRPPIPAVFFSSTSSGSSV